MIVLGANGTYRAGTQGLYDTLYADWASATTDINWINTPASDQIVNSVTVAGFERMLLTTGSGNDNIDNAARGGVATDDYIVAGLGADTVKTGQGHDYIDTGDGNDSIDAGAYNDTVLAGSGDDTITLNPDGLELGGRR
jgi:Ca2+-binding RTX toxin-like protein